VLIRYTTRVTIHGVSERGNSWAAQGEPRPGARARAGAARAEAARAEAARAEAARAGAARAEVASGAALPVGAAVPDGARS